MKEKIEQVKELVLRMSTLPQNFNDAMMAKSYMRQISEILDSLQVSSESNFSKSVDEFVSSLDYQQKDLLYSRLLSEHVRSDAASKVSERVNSADIDSDIGNAIAEEVAHRYAYNGDYDCNESYWDNIDRLINEAFKAKEHDRKIKCLRNDIEDCMERRGFRCSCNFIDNVASRYLKEYPVLSNDSDDYFSSLGHIIDEELGCRRTPKGKVYFECRSQDDLVHRLSYWSNACGDFFHNNKWIDDVSGLPDDLQRAYKELWEEGNGCLEYLVEFNGKCYIALSSEFDSEYAASCNISSDELYDLIKEKAICIFDQELLKDTVLLIGKSVSDDDCSEVVFLVPAMESKTNYDLIEQQISENIDLS